MSGYQPDIIPNSPTGQALQAAIQKKLALQGWSSEDDAVMAEYCLVMLGNKKTSDQIASELSDLIGSDFDPSFVSWLFAELSHHYPDPSAPSTSSSTSINVIHDSRHSPPRGNNASGNRREVFGAAVSGLKRDADSMGGGGGREGQRARYERPNQGQGFDGVPSGPRNQNGAGGGRERRDERTGKSIFDRVQQGGGQGGGFGNQNGGFDPVQNAIESATYGGGRGGPPPQLSMSQQQAAFQAQAMAMAQAFAAMQAGGFGFNPAAGFNGAPQVPQGFVPPPGGGFGHMMGGVQPQGYPGGMQGGGGRGGFNGGGGQGGKRNNKNQNFQQHQQQPSSFPLPQSAPHLLSQLNQQATPFTPSHQQPHHQQQQKPLPTKPVEEQICKHATECTKPSCPYSHPSPAATKESGLVLSSEPCEKGLDCADPDCPKSHVSASQKRSPLSSSTTSAPVVPAPPPPAPVVPPSQIPGAGERNCKFAGACTRPGCVFLHPWDVKGDPGNTGGVPCRWGENCTRADCHFSHPPSRPPPFQPHHQKKPFTPTPTYSKSTYSTTFNNPLNPPIGAWPSEGKDHVSERLKRFAGGATTAEGGVERIIPGESTATAGKEEEKMEKVEIELEKESPKAEIVEEKKEEVAV